MELTLPNYTGPFTDAVLSYLRVQYRKPWGELRELGGNGWRFRASRDAPELLRASRYGGNLPEQWGDIKVLSITGFSPGVGCVLSPFLFANEDLGDERTKSDLTDVRSRRLAHLSQSHGLGGCQRPGRYGSARLCRQLEESEGSGHLDLVGLYTSFVACNPLPFLSSVRPLAERGGDQELVLAYATRSRSER